MNKCAQDNVIIMIATTIIPLLHYVRMNQGQFSKLRVIFYYSILWLLTTIYDLTTQWLS